MKALFAPAGTLGDIQAPLALALRLHEGGHDVTVACSENFAGLVRSRGLRFSACGPDFQAELRKEPDAQITGSRSQLRSWGRILRRSLEAQSMILPELSQGVELIVGSGLLFMGPSAAELRSVPYVHLTHVPTAIPSDRHAPYVVEYKPRPKFVNRALWIASRLGTEASILGYINEGRALMGLPPLRDYGSYYGKNVVLAADRSLVPPLEGEGTAFQRTGYWQAPPAGGLDAGVEEFLDSGEAPVYIGFGSMAAPQGERIEAALAKIILSGTRLLLGGALAQYAEGLGEAAYPAIGLDHQLLFPRVSAAIHHGGAGTTYTAARAGIPQVIIPHIMDQFYWATRVSELGIGLRCGSYSRLRGGEIASAIARVKADSSYRARAQELAQKMQCEAALREAETLLFRAAEGEQPNGET